MDRLVRWKEKEQRKPLILWGARQVGKTWLMKEFGRRYFKDTVYLSFFNNTSMSSVFARDFDIKRILTALEIDQHKEIRPGETLLIFDEIQETPKVLESLKYFCEAAPEYPVIAAGSLLGVSLHEGVSFPVGKVEELRLYPMNFREFLMAMGEERLCDLCGDPRRPELKDHSEKYAGLLKEYYCVGGMPEAVSRYAESRDLQDAREVQLSLLGQYEGDFGKHVSPRELPRIRMVWNSLPVQLAKENRKFFFGQIRKGARQKDFEIAIQWLKDAGLIYQVHKVSSPSMPLKAYLDFSSFKLFMLDLGLLGAMSELDLKSVVRGNRIFTEFKGALTEQYVLQQLVSDTAYTPYYYSGEKSTYETDFLIQKAGSVVPLVVKAENNLRSKSLRFYYEKFHPDLALRISASDYMDQEWMENIPLWAVHGI